MSQHANISIFVPHIGCPNRCSFCDQRSITGFGRAPRTGDVIKAVKTAVNSKGYDAKNTEIAFFGGSFTAINRNYMLDLLRTASAFVRDGTVNGIRISTRPDAIDDEVLSLLREYGVTAIELGAQSMSDRVLRMNNRGHTSEDVAVASMKIREYGFSLGLQMMTGLYGDSERTSVMTANKIIEIHPDTVRIYPTIVLKNTDLEALYADNKYEPQNLEDATNLAAKLLKMFNKAGIRVIRLGLHSIEKNSFVAGPWHPAFSELCTSKIYLENAKAQLKEKGSYNLYVNSSAVSKMAGQGRRNIEELKAEGYGCRIKTDNTLEEYKVIAERVGE